MPEVPLRYTAWAQARRQELRAEKLERHVKYWRAQLADVEPLALPLDHFWAASRNPEGERIALNLAPRLQKALQALSESRSVSLFMVVLSALKRLLQRQTGQDDITVGFPFSGRTKQETKEAVGQFVNTLLARTHLSGNPSFLGTAGQSASCRSGSLPSL